jgi:hypothetical protein
LAAAERAAVAGVAATDLALAAGALDLAAAFTGDLL